MCKKILIWVGCGLILLGALGYAGYNVYKYMQIHDVHLPIGKEEIPNESFASILPATSSNAEEYGYGITREITGELKGATDESAKSLGDLDFDNLEDDLSNTIQLVGQLKGEQDEINTYVEKKEKEYHSTINWTNGDITQVQYDSLLAVCGLITEDKLNESEPGRYTVEAKRPSMDYLESQGVEVMFDLDDENRMLIWVDLITRDSKEQTEVEEVKLFTMYYEAGTDVLRIQ